MMMRALAMSAGARNASSARRSNANPAIAPGTVATTRSPTRRSSGDSMRPPRFTIRAAAPSKRPHSARKYHSTATSVPTCSATSNERPGSCQPNTQGASVKCAELLTGRNSDSPCRIPSTIA